MLSKSFYETRIILTPRPYTSSTKQTNKNKHVQKNYRSICLISIDTKILNEILVNLTQPYAKRIVSHGQVGFILGI